MTRKLKYFLTSLFIIGWLFLFGPNVAYGDEVPAPAEQVVISPAQQAVNTALITATSEVSQAVAASDTATVTVATAVQAVTTSNTAVSAANTAVSFATAAVAEVSNVSTAIETATAVTQTVTQTVTGVAQAVASIPVNATTQSPEVLTAQSVIIAATPIVESATTAVIATAVPLIIETPTTVAQVSAAIATEITQSETATVLVQAAQTAIDTATATVAMANTAVAAVTPARTEAQTQLTQANIAINNAQDAVNALVATIGTTRNVLANTDDAGVRMILPFNLQMGGVTYSNVYVGSNATITFGVNEGQNYYSTPNAPSISIAGYDWTTWSNGSGVTYSTTTNTLSIAWDVRPYPQTSADTQMTQIRFNADVNPADGAWSADVNVTGYIPADSRFNVRETTGGAVTNIVDTNSGPGFNGTISQGATFTPIPDPNTATVQAAIETANAQIAALNSAITTVVAANTASNMPIASIATISNNTITALNAAITELTNKTNAIAIVSTAVEKVLTAPTIIQTAQTIINSIPSPAPVLVPTSPDPVEPPAVEPPAEEPPVVELPAEEPPVVEPPAEEPPAEEPPATVEETIKDALEDGKLTETEKKIIAEALIASVAPGETLSSEEIKEAGLEYKDLPASTPVDVRTDENGNSVIITAEVAAQVELLQDPAAFAVELFSNPGAALAALGSIGADMSPEERKEATDMVVATVVAAGAAMNAVGAAAGATGGSTGGSHSGGGNSGGSGGGGASGDSKGIRRRRP